MRSELISLLDETDIKQQLLALAEREKERDLRTKNFMILMAKIANLNPVEQYIIVPEELPSLEEANWGIDNSAIKSLPVEEDKNEEAVKGSQEEDEEQEAANSTLGEGEEMVVVKSLQEKEKKAIKKMKFEDMRIVIDSLEREGIADQEMECVIISIADQEMECVIISIYSLSSLLINLDNQRFWMGNLLDILGGSGIANDEMETFVMKLAELLDWEMLMVIPRLLDGNGIQLDQ